MSATASTTAVVAACERVSVSYGQDEARVAALSDVDLAVRKGETLALWGSSGSGKTTLLHVLGGLVTPTSGSVTWEGEPLSSLDASARGRVRARGIAYVFQGSNLLPHFTAYENVAFAVHVRGGSAGGDRRPAELLELVGLGAKRDALPGELSGGEAQRVAIARALGQQPRLLACDEPTGQLDSDTGERVLDLIEAVQREFGFAMVTATHDAGVASRASRVLALADGRVVDEEGPQ